MNNKFYLAIVLAIVIGVGFFVFAEEDASATDEIEGAQVVKLHVEGGQYVLEPESIKVGIPVRIEADMEKMPGCSRSIVIPAFNVRKNLGNTDNSIEFTPTKSGTFNIACSMNMYKGTFKVLDESGKEPQYVEPKNTQASSCSTGGCGGCGG
jgi:plastocyanin domain-containing protein